MLYAVCCMLYAVCCMLCAVCRREVVRHAGARALGGARARSLAHADASLAIRKAVLQTERPASTAQVLSGLPAFLPFSLSAFLPFSTLYTHSSPSLSSVFHISLITSLFLSFMLTHLFRLLNYSVGHLYSHYLHLTSSICIALILQTSC